MSDRPAIERERLLFVAPWVPSKQRPRSLGILKMLVVDYDVTVLLLSWSEQDAADARQLTSLLPGGVAVRVLRLQRLGGLVRASLAVFSGRSLQQAFTNSRRARVAVRTAVADVKPHVTFFNVIRSANFVSIGSGVRVIDLDEFRSDYYRQLLVTSRNPLWRVIAAIEVQRLRRAEGQVLEDADAVLVSSPAELRSNDVVHLVRSPHALALTPNRKHRVELDGPSTLFVGRLSYRANREALRWYVHEVIPELRRRGAAGSLYIVGRGAGRDVSKLVAQDVRLIGAVEDVAPFYAAADVCIVPIQMATGVQMKLIEAAVLGRAIVTTKVSADRAGMTAGVHCLVAETPEEWADAVQQLHESDQMRAVLGASAKAWAAEAYDSRVIEESLRRAMAAAGGLSPHER